MTANDAYLFYEAGQVVAATHLGLSIRFASADVLRPSEVTIPRDDPRSLITLMLTGMAAERKGVGQSDPLRRTRNRIRLRRTVDATIAAMKGSLAKRTKEGKRMVSQAQDQANNLCSTLFDAIEQIVERLRKSPELSGAEIVEIVKGVKAKRRMKAKKSRAVAPPKKTGSGKAAGSDNQRKGRAK